MIKHSFFIIAIIAITIINKSFAQTHPFPQNVKYKYGYMSKNINATHAQKVYEIWKNVCIRYCGTNEARVIKHINGIETTVSEGIGYGMAIVAYAADKDLFDKLLNYHIARRNKHGMMNWIYEVCETGDNKKNGATDADLDAAIALVVASKQWPQDARYKTEAGKLIDSLQKWNFTECGNTIIQKAGDDFGGCTCTNPSYYSPAYYRVFAKFKEEEGKLSARDFWNKAASDSYITLLKNANPNTGLVYAWTNSDGGNPSDCYYEVSGSGTFNSYQYDACRTPWRIATDYLWWGNEQAKDWTQKINHFVNAPIYKQTASNGDIWYGAGGIENVVDGYWSNGLRRIDPNGTTYGHRHSIPFVGAFALAAMSSNQKDVDACMKDFAAKVPSEYYETCLCVLYTFLATGNFWNPYEGK